MIQLEVPATTANLGPGFDSLGLALSLKAHFAVELLPEALVVEGCPAAFSNADNLFVRAFRLTQKRIGKPSGGLHVSITSEVPVARGLGSSATLIAGGVASANAIYGHPLADDELLALATQLEGHPDNVAPALFGGLTACMMAHDRPVCVPLPLADGWHLTALIPNFELSTQLARGVLPASIPHKDAVFNISHALVLTHALRTGDAALLHTALCDKLHEPYRAQLIDGYDSTRAAALAAGADGVFLSGAGPTLMCISRDAGLAARIAPTLDENWRAMPLTASLQGVVVKGAAA